MIIQPILSYCFVIDSISIRIGTALDLLIDNMNDRLKNISTEIAEGTEIHRIQPVWT